MPSTWDIMTYTITGSLGLGILVGAGSEHYATKEGWTPPVMLDEREPVPPLVTDWLSPARLQRLAHPEPPASDAEEEAPPEGPD